MVRTYTFRTWGNAIGAHLHDEPGLTYAKHPHTGQFTAADVPAQRAAYQRAFGQEPIWQDQVDVNNPASLAQWIAASDFKLGLHGRLLAAGAVRGGEDEARLPRRSRRASMRGTPWPTAIISTWCGACRSSAATAATTTTACARFNPLWYLEFALPRQMDKPDLVPARVVQPDQRAVPRGALRLFRRRASRACARRRCRCGARPPSLAPTASSRPTR